MTDDNYIDDLQRYSSDEMKDVLQAFAQSMAAPVDLEQPPEAKQEKSGRDR